MSKTIQEAAGKNYSYRSDIEHYEHGAVGDVNTGRTFKKVQDVPIQTVVDPSSANVVYIGEAAHGSATSDALWRICKITTTSSGESYDYTDGDDKFDNVWDNRSSLSYGAGDVTGLNQVFMSGDNVIFMSGDNMIFQ